MSINAEDLNPTGKTISDAGSFVEKTADATRGSRSRLGRVGAALTGVKLGARLLPLGLRVFRRYPLASALAVVGVVFVVYAMRSARSREARVAY
jgi:hypothetical protein